MGKSSGVFEALIRRLEMDYRRLSRQIAATEKSYQAVPLQEMRAKLENLKGQLQGISKALDHVESMRTRELLEGVQREKEGMEH